MHCVDECRCLWRNLSVHANILTCRYGLVQINIHGNKAMHLFLTKCCNPDLTLLQYIHGQRSAAPEVVEGNDNDQR
jgi:hypothetical protein